MNVSIVSVSRRAGLPHFGHWQLTNSLTEASGDTEPASNRTFSGSRIGNSSFGAATAPQSSQ